MRQERGKLLNAEQFSVDEGGGEIGRAPERNKFQEKSLKTSSGGAVQFGERKEKEEEVERGQDGLGIIETSLFRKRSIW